MKYKDYVPTIYEYDKEKNLRYVLGNSGKNPLICIGINPNVACKEYSDRTMNILISFSKKNNYDSCIMINPYPLICSKPKDLPKELDKDIINKNLIYIEKIFSEDKEKDVLVMWGDYVLYNEDFKNSVIKILNLGLKYKMNFFNINNLSKSGNPYHLMYLCRDKEFNDENYKIKKFDVDKYLEKL